MGENYLLTCIAKEILLCHPQELHDRQEVAVVAAVPGHQAHAQGRQLRAVQAGPRQEDRLRRRQHRHRHQVIAGHIMVTK